MKDEKEEKKKFTTISIPTPLFEKIKERIKGTGFTSVSSYVTYVLRELLVEKEEEEVRAIVADMFIQYPEEVYVGNEDYIMRVSQQIQNK